MYISCWYFRIVLSLLRCVTGLYQLLIFSYSIISITLQYSFILFLAAITWSERPFNLYHRGLPVTWSTVRGVSFPLFSSSSSSYHYYAMKISLIMSLGTSFHAITCTGVRSFSLLVFNFLFCLFIVCIFVWLFFILRCIFLLFFLPSSYSVFL